MNLWLPRIFAAPCLASAAVAAISAIILLGVQLPGATVAGAGAAGGRGLRAVARQPLFITAVICGVASCLIMNFLMTAAPLAMRISGLSQEVSNPAIQWHVIAMYAPSFFTGRLDHAPRCGARGGGRGSCRNGVMAAEPHGAFLNAAPVMRGYRLGGSWPYAGWLSSGGSP